MSDKWCTTCGLLTTACRCSQLDRCSECNGLIVEGFCDCDDAREDEDEIDDCDCDCCLGICTAEYCDICNPYVISTAYAYIRCARSLLS